MKSNNYYTPLHGYSIATLKAIKLVKISYYKTSFVTARTFWTGSGQTTTAEFHNWS